MALARTLAVATLAASGHALKVAHAPALKPVLVLRGGFNPIAPLAKAYAAQLAIAPMATNVATAAALSVVADGVAQKVSTGGKDAPWDFARSGWIVLWGGLVSGYLMSQWFGFLGGLFPDARTSVSQLVLKVFVNQMCLSPCLNAGFFAFAILTGAKPIARMSSENWSALGNKLKADLWPTFMKGNYYWSCVQFINFKVLPPSVTVLSTNVAFLFWTIYLCIIGNREAKV